MVATEPFLKLREQEVFALLPAEAGNVLHKFVPLVHILVESARGFTY